jgi:murein tripeptide amidase MpaA
MPCNSFLILQSSSQVGFKMQFFKIILAFATLVSAEEKQLFHVKGPKAIFDAAMQTFPELDVWEISSIEDNLVTADIYTFPSVIEQFVPKTESGINIFGVQIEEAPISISQQIADERASTLACKTRTANATLAGKYTEDSFFDCWRTYDEVYSFLDRLVSENPTIFSKIEGVSKTVEGRNIPAYKVSTGARKKSLYTEGLIHAREWQSGSTTFFIISHFIDSLRANDGVVTKIFDEYDWYFVPIVNIDGYKYTWESDRMWRKNRRKNDNNSYGVDLNRNFGPVEFFNKGASNNPRSESYPGPNVLSEPETTGIFKFLKSLPGLSGAIDIHCYSNLVLRPFGNQAKEAAEPYGSKLKAIGNAVRDAVQRGSNVRYTSQTAQQLYYAYGTFLDSLFLEFNKIASITFELEGNSFIVSESTIRPVGQRIAEGLKQFALELKNYYA